MSACAKRKRDAMSARADDLASFTATDDALVLASVSSAAELELLDNWLTSSSAENTRTRRSRYSQLPADDDPPPGVVAQLVESAQPPTRTAPSFPVRVFWVPGGLPTRVKLVGLISGRDTYRPPEILQRRILRKDPTPGARGGGGAGQGFRAAPAVAGHHGRLTIRATSRGSCCAARRWPSNGSNFACSDRNTSRPRLVKPEMLASARFIEGLRTDPGRDRRKGRGNARRAVHRLEPLLRRPHPVVGPRDLQPRIRPEHRLRPRPSRAHARTRWRTTRRCCCFRIGPISTG